NLASRVRIVLLPLPAGKHRHGLEKVGILYSVEYGVCGPQLLCLLPIIVQPKVFSGFCVVFAVTSEYGGEKLEDAEWQAADVDLFKHRCDSGLFGLLIELDSRDLVAESRLDEFFMELLRNVAVRAIENP